MVKISLRLDKRYRLSDGKYPVKMAVARNGKTLYVPVGLTLKEEDWDAKAINHVKNIPQRKSVNAFLNGQLSRAELMVQDLQTKGEMKTLSDKELINFLSQERIKEETVKEQFFATHASELMQEKRKENTVKTYDNAIQRIKKFCDYDSLQVTEINKMWVEDFISYLTKEKLNPNTINLYISKIRSVYKKAEDEGIVTIPFPRVRIKYQPTRKRNLTIEQVRTLWKGKYRKIQQRYIDIFFLMLMMRGINMIDLFGLKADAIKNGRLQYNRSKTGKLYDIKIEPEMQEIIERYKGKEKLLAFFDSKNVDYAYVFSDCLRIVLQNAAKKVGITEKVSAYYSRHTWATLAIELGATMEMVSAGLGHSIGADVTQVYVAFRQKQIDDLARRVIDYVFEKGEFAKKI